MQEETNVLKGRLPYKELKGKGSVSAQADEAWDYSRSRKLLLLQQSPAADVLPGLFSLCTY